MILSGSDVRDKRDRWEQANDWLTAIAESQELPAERMDSFHRWISDDKNRHAFDRVEALLRDRKHCRDRDVASLTERQTDSYDPRISLKQWLKRGPTRQMAQRRRVMVGLIGAVAASGVITILLLPGLFPTDGRSDSLTRIAPSGPLSGLAQGRLQGAPATLSRGSPEHPEW